MDNTQYIDDYLEGILGDQEKIAFEVRLREDQVFASEYETQRSAHALINSMGVFRTKEKLREHEVRKYGKGSVRLFIRIGAVAAVLLMAFAMVFLFTSKEPVTNESLFAVFFTPYRDPVVVRSDAASDDLRGKANNAYRSQDFAAAKLYYSQITDLTHVDKFYYGLSALQASDDQLAILLLKEMAESKTDYEQQARWYLALVYLKNDNRNDALNELTRIVNEKGYKHIEAQELLKKLNQ